MNLYMENLLSLLDFAQQHNIEVDWFSMRRAESLSVPLPDGSHCIAIDHKKIRSCADAVCKLTHEFGHCATGAFYNRYSNFDLRQKHENRADKWAIKKLIPKDELEEAVHSGKKTSWELAEYFGVTEDFMKKAVCYYTNGNLATELYF